MVASRFLNGVRSARSFLFRHTIIFGLVSLALIGIVVYFLFLKTTPVVTTLQDVRAVRKSISTNVSGSGTITPTNTVVLKAKGSGDLRLVSAKAGSVVRQGATLMSLDAATAYQKVQTAQVNLETAQLELDKIRQPADSLSVLQLKNQIASAEQKIKDQDVLVSNVRLSLLNVSFEAVPEIQTTPEAAPTITGSYMGTEEGQIKVATYMSGNGLRFMMTGLATGDGLVSPTTAQPLGATGLYIKFGSSDNQPTWIISIPNKKASGYLNAYNAYQNALITKDKTIAEQTRALAELHAELENLQAGADMLDVRAKELVVAQKKNDLANAYTELSNYIVTAPFDGTIASVTAEVGDSISPSTSLGTIITNKKIAEISLNEADISKVSVGQKGVLTFDAIEGMTASGTIAEIDTLGTTSQGVVTYKVKIAFSDIDKRIKPGMTVSADIELERKDDAIVVPSEAVKTLRGKKYVETRDSNGTSTIATKQIEVVTGISNDTETEIVSGLDEHATIVVRRRVSATPAAQAPSLIGGGGSKSGTGIPRQEGF